MNLVSPHSTIQAHLKHFRVLRNYYKGHMGETKGVGGGGEGGQFGWGGVEEWGEDADNCN